METIKIKQDTNGSWLAMLPSVGEWLITPFFAPCPASVVAAELEKSNPGHQVKIMAGTCGFCGADAHHGLAVDDSPVCCACAESMEGAQ